jgi:hypothetical protein
MALVITIIVIVTRPGPFTAADARRAGVAVLIGDTVFLPSGSTTTLGLARDANVYELTVVRGGFLATVDEPDATTTGTDLRLIHPGGSYEEIATSADSHYEITSDGRTVVVRSTDTAGKVALRSIDVGTGRQLHTYGDGDQYVASLNGDWAVVSSMGNARAWMPSELWNVRTGVVVPFASYDGVAAWGVSPDGDVLLGVDTDPAARPDSRAHACFDTVAPVNSGTQPTLPTGPTGYCGTFDVTDATVSPDGTWAVLIPQTDSPGHGIVAVRAADLHAGRWAPVNLDEADGMSKPLFWDSSTTFIAPYVTASGDNRYERCSVDGRCRDLGVPGSALIAQSFGG